MPPTSPPRPHPSQPVEVEAGEAAAAAEGQARCYQLRRSSRGLSRRAWVRQRRSRARRHALGLRLGILCGCDDGNSLFPDGKDFAPPHTRFPHTLPSPSPHTLTSVRMRFFAQDGTILLLAELTRVDACTHICALTNAPSDANQDSQKLTPSACVPRSRRLCTECTRPRLGAVDARRNDDHVSTRFNERNRQCTITCHAHSWATDGCCVQTRVCTGWLPFKLSAIFVGRSPSSSSSSRPCSGSFLWASLGTLASTSRAPCARLVPRSTGLARSLKRRMAAGSWTWMLPIWRLPFSSATFS